MALTAATVSLGAVIYTITDAQAVHCRFGAVIIAVAINLVAGLEG